MDEKRFIEEMSAVIRFTYKYATLHETGFEVDPELEDIKKIFEGYIVESLTKNQD